MLQTFKSAFASKDLRKKIFLTLFIIIIYRIGCFVPIPGLNPDVISSSMNQSNSLFSMLNMMTGQSMSNGTLFALGIVPFINAFIIMQLLTLIIPKLEKLSKEGGEEGRNKINQYTRFFAIILAVIQAIGLLFTWQNSATETISNPIMPIFGSGQVSEIFTMICIVIIFTAGSAIVMWLSERITEFGIGNGTSIIIFIGIISGLGYNLYQGLFENIPAQMAGGDFTGIWYIFGFILLVVGLFGFIVFVDLAERRITVNYAKQVKGNKMYGGQSTHIPLKVNASGVMPIIFAMSLVMFPQMIITFAQLGATDFGIFYATWLGVGGHLYPFILLVLIIFFAYFYSQIQFNPDDVSRMIQQNGGFVPGIRPGKATSDYLKKINNRITLFGALFLGIISMVPLILTAIPGFKIFGFDQSFSATGLLIVVSVALEIQKQLESQLLVKNNKGFLK